MKSFTAFFALILFLIPGLTIAQDDPNTLRQFRKVVFELQQEMLQLKEEFDRQKKELQSQKEYLTLQVEKLISENKKFKKSLLEMDSLLFQFEDRLASSAVMKLNSELNNLRSFNQALLLDSLGHSEEAEKLLLDIINQPETSLPKDLLILILAQQKRKLGLIEESLSYYSTLLAEFFGSPYFTQAIFEMSDVLGESGKKDQQLTLLIQLSAISKTDKYSNRAIEKLKELGSEPVLEEEVEPDSIGDVFQETGEPLDATTDTDSLSAEINDSTGDASVTSETDLSKPEQMKKPEDASGDEAAHQTLAEENTPGIPAEAIPESSSNQDVTSDMSEDNKETSDIAPVLSADNQSVENEVPADPDIQIDDQSVEEVPAESTTQ